MARSIDKRLGRSRLRLVKAQGNRRWTVVMACSGQDSNWLVDEIECVAEYIFDAVIERDAGNLHSRSIHSHWPTFTGFESLQSLSSAQE